MASAGVRCPQGSRGSRALGPGFEDRRLSDDDIGIVSGGDHHVVAGAGGSLPLLLALAHAEVPVPLVYLLAIGRLIRSSLYNNKTRLREY